MTELNGTPQPNRIFVRLGNDAILDVRDVRKKGDGIAGRVANGAYPIELIDGVMFIPGTKHAPAEGVRIIYEGAPPIGTRSDYYGPSIEWIRANQEKWIQA
jgi:hypothetical protein